MDVRVCVLYVTLARRLRLWLPGWKGRACTVFQERIPPSSTWEVSGSLSRLSVPGKLTVKGRVPISMMDDSTKQRHKIGWTQLEKSTKTRCECVSCLWLETYSVHLARTHEQPSSFSSVFPLLQLARFLLESMAEFYDIHIRTDCCRAAS